MKRICFVPFWVDELRWGTKTLRILRECDGASMPAGRRAFYHMWRASTVVWFGLRDGALAGRPHSQANESGLCRRGATLAGRPAEVGAARVPLPRGRVQAPGGNLCLGAHPEQLARAGVHRGTHRADLEAADGLGGGSFRDPSSADRHGSPHRRRESARPHHGLAAVPVAAVKGSSSTRHSVERRSTSRRCSREPPPTVRSQAMRTCLD
jgi:hypothetical protein